MKDSIDTYFRQPQLVVNPSVKKLQEFLVQLGKKVEEDMKTQVIALVQVK